MTAAPQPRPLLKTGGTPAKPGRSSPTPGRPGEPPGPRSVLDRLFRQPAHCCGGEVCTGRILRDERYRSELSRRTAGASWAGRREVWKGARGRRTRGDGGTKRHRRPANRRLRWLFLATAVVWSLTSCRGLSYLPAVSSSLVTARSVDQPAAATRRRPSSGRSRRKLACHHFAGSSFSWVAPESAPGHSRRRHPGCRPRTIFNDRR